MAVVEWAAMKGHTLAYHAEDNTVVCHWSEVRHDNTPAGIASAVLLAIAKATGFEDGK
jgi:hypothetical protein